MNIVEISQILASVFTGASVVAAIYIFHRTNEKEYFRGFRNSLVTYRQLLDEASELFDETGLTEVGYSISKQLIDICPPNINPTEIEAFLFDERNINVITQAIYLGLGESKTINRGNEILRELQKVPSAHVESFPTTNATLSILNAHFGALSSTIANGELIINIFESASDEFNKTKEPSVKENEDVKLVLRELGVHISALHTETVNHLADTIVEHSDQIASIIIHSYAKKSDRELRKISIKESKSYKGLMDNVEGVDSSKKLFELLKFYKPYIDGDDWDAIVESKALIENSMQNNDVDE